MANFTLQNRVNIMFSAYDLQTNDYFHTGRNSNTKEECQEGIINFLLEGEDDALLESAEKEILDLFEVEIHEHSEPIL